MEMRSSSLPASTETPFSTATHQVPVSVVAIIAGAGSTPALSVLLRQLPTLTGIAYIVVPHYADGKEAAAVDLQTGPAALPLQLVQEETLITSGMVYLVPPGGQPAFVNGKLVLLPFVKKEVGFCSTSFFLTSVCKNYRGRLVAVLSGSMEARFLESICYAKAEGCIVVAEKARQNPAGALQDADLFFEQHQFTVVLETLLAHPYFREPGSAFFPDDQLEELFRLIYNLKRKDLSVYKKAVVRRRAGRHMAIQKMVKPENYLHFLERRTALLEALYQELVYNPSVFFQELSNYQALVKTVFPALVKRKTEGEEGPLRIWCPACHTGEEVFSIAIQLADFLKSRETDLPVQIFGTDLNEQAIKQARTGLFQPAALLNVPPQRLKKYFEKTDRGYQVVKSIRNNCIFAQQDLLNDPPFSRIDLISIQSTIIDLAAGRHRKILQSLHYGLTAAGFLILGRLEQIDPEAYLSKADKGTNLFSKSVEEEPYPVQASVQAGNLLQRSVIPGLFQAKNGYRGLETASIDKAAENLLLSRYVPASVVVDHHFRAIRFYGPVYRYVQPLPGQEPPDLLPLLPPALATALTTLVEQATVRDQIVRQPAIPLVLERTITYIDIEVTPVAADTGSACFLIVFEEAASRNNREALLSTAGSHPQVWMEQHLAQARNQAQQLSEMLTEAQEGWQAEKEEITSNNQELQILNHDLENSNQELRNTLEGLLITNEELQTQNSVLSDSVEYAMAMTEAIREPLVILNANLSIHIANKTFYNTFGLTPVTAEGYLLYKIDNSRWNVPELMTKLNQVTERKSGSTSFELTLSDDRVYLFNASYIDTRFKGQGCLVLTIRDITQLQKIREAKEWLATAVQAAGEGMISFSASRTIISWNKGAEKIFGYTESEIMCRSITRLVRSQDKLSQQKMIQRVLNGEAIQQMEAVYLHKEGHPIDVSISVSPITDEKKNIKGLLASVQDITERRRVATSLQKTQESLQMALEAASMGTWELDMDTRIVLHRNSRYDQVFGYKSWLGPWTVDTTRQHILEDDLPLFDAAVDRMLKEGHLLMELRIKWPDHTIHWIRKEGRVFFDAAGRPYHAAGIVMDITPRKLIEQKREAILGLASHELKNPVTSIKAYAQLLYDQLLQEKAYNAAAMVNKLDKEVDRLTQLINELLDMKRLADYLAETVPDSGN